MDIEQLDARYDAINREIRALFDKLPLPPDFHERQEMLLAEQDELETEYEKLLPTQADPRSNPAFHRKHLERDFELSIRGLINRRRIARVHQVIPDQYFANASHECRDMFVHGHFYGTITLIQSVGEGISRFLYTKSGRNPRHDHDQRIAVLGAENVISDAAFQAFRTIRGKDRDDFHHLNPSIERDRFILEDRAAECIECLRVIQADVFDFTWNEGRLVPKHPQYWPTSQDDPNAICVHVDFT